jgi:hypothetical protein
MRELFERFSYRYQIWRQERQGDYSEADPAARNPLRIIAMVTLIGVILDMADPFVFHRSPDILKIFFIPAGILFLTLYYSGSRWAWHLPVVWVVFVFFGYWSLRLVGYSPISHASIGSTLTLGSPYSTS